MFMKRLILISIFLLIGSSSFAQTGIAKTGGACIMSLSLPDNTSIKINVDYITAYRFDKGGTIVSMISQEFKVKETPDVVSKKIMDCNK